MIVNPAATVPGGSRRHVLWPVLLFGVTATAQTPQFLLAPGRAGSFEIGVPVDTVVRAWGRARVRLVDLQQEGQTTPAIEIRLADADTAPALVAPVREWPCAELAVWGITVYDRRFRTQQGIGVGSTIGDLRRAYDVRLSREEGHSVVVPSLKMTFAISGSTFADSVRVSSVWLWPDPNEVRQRRCPGAGS